jgi:hypothetical protein
VRFLSLQLDGDGLKQFDAVGIEGGWRTLEVPLGDHVYFVDVKRTTPGTHTTPPVEDDQPPTHDEVAEVVGRMWIALIAQDAVGRRKRRKEAARA